jgi:hypothetical protein
VALGLWRRTLWGWRLGLISGLLGLASGVLVITGLILSWAYLRGIYGAVGHGAALLSLLVAAVVFEVLGLLPAMQLRALLRREVRRDFGAAKAVQQAMVLLLLVPLASLLVGAVYAQPTPIAAVTTEAQAQALAVLRAALQGRERPPTPALVGVPLGSGPLYVSLWHSGTLDRAGTGRRRRPGPGDDLQGHGGQALPAGAARALDFLTGPKYATFIGWFAYGEDHWTCIAAEEAWPHLPSPRYMDFCRGYAAYLRRLQYHARHPVFAGHYGFSYVLVPQTPATAGYTEAMIAAYKLSVHHGQANAVLKAQVLNALEALRRDQLRDDNSYLATSPREADGGIRRSIVEQDIRLDFTQHALSAFIRGAAL